MCKRMMDCHLIQPHHCSSICFTNQRDIFAEKLLARQSCTDGWRQHIKGLCGSAVSINGLSRSLLPSGSSTQGYIITMLPAAECKGQTFKGNGIGSKQRHYFYSQHQRWAVPVSCHSCRALLTLWGKLPCVHVFNLEFFSSALWFHWISISDPLYASS